MTINEQEEVSTMAIHQEITVNGDTTKIYNTLMSSEEFAAFTNAPAEIDSTAGGSFSCFGDQITGRNIELKENEMIVQAWRVAAWPDGVYSIVRFTLTPVGPETRLTLDHTGFPDDAGEHLDGGWHKMYWDPLKEYCA